MNRFIYFFLLLGCTASALVGCTDDPNVEPLSPGCGDGGSSWVTLDLGDNSFDKVNITTRATLDNSAESRVLNLFVFIFGPKDEKGDAQRLYGRFFDHTNRMDSKFELWDSKVDCWWVTGNAADEEPEGKVRMYVPAVANGSLYVLANVNADMVNISPEKLRFVQTLSDLKTLTASLNQQVTERNGFFPMTGFADPVSISSGDIVIPEANGNTGGKILLTRMDAKVEVKLRVAKGYMDFTTSTTTEGETSSTQSGTTEGGSDIPQTGTTTVKTLHKIKSFVPLSWQVVNLPRTAFVLPHDTDVPDKEMFNTRETKFETRKSGILVTYQQKKIDSITYEYIYKTDGSGEIATIEKTDTTEEHGFSFYMLENRVTANSEIPETQVTNEGKGYHARETRLKNGDGTYKADPDVTNNIWKYAPAEGTYLVIKGEIVMALDLSNEGKNQQLSADAVYYIHLGDFGSDIDDYSVLRNTSYTYTITIYGVDNIQIEVEKKTEENESGATGHVYVAKESIFTFDSHYGRAVISFDSGHLNSVDDLLWYVRTPFGREGAPHVINGVEVPAGLDYQWVHFMINERDNSGNYLHTHAKYNPEKVMNILEFSKYIKEQKKAFDAGKPNDFRREFDQDWYNKFGEGKNKEDDGEWYRYRIYLTIFVDEFYYDADPLTGDVRQDLWKDFVNQPNRLMHILCDTDMSKDEASRSTGSVVTIRQRSIQTIFNTEKPELKTAWGCETIDETRDLLWYFSRKEQYNSSTGHLDIPEDAKASAVSVGNDSDGNGLYNTGRIWGMLKGWDDVTKKAAKFEPKRWSDYVDYDRKSGLRDNDTIETMRYSCMTRNRDEDGDDIIDAKEVKWYLAAISQLGSLYVGDQGLSSEAVLYPYYKQQVEGNVPDPKTGVYPWRAHIVSSTYFDGAGLPQIMWAEEGLSTGSYDQKWGKFASMTVRCVRNLGMDPSNEDEKQAELEAQENLKSKNLIPAQAIKVTGPGLNDNTEQVTTNSVYEFDLTNLNPLSIRYYTSRELEPRDENSVEARVYWCFVTDDALSEESYTYDELYNLIRDGRSPCPEGYRTPNVREGALMSLRCPWAWQGDTPTRVSTYYSHGLRGTDQDPGAEGGKSNSWFFNGTKTYLDNKAKQKVRCVKDVRQ